MPSPSRSSHEQFPTTLHYPTQQHPTNLPLDTIPRLHDPAIRAHKQTFPNPRQPLCPLSLPPPDNHLQIPVSDPHALPRLTLQFAFPQHRLTVPVLHPYPKAPAGDVGLRYGCFRGVGRGGEGVWHGRAGEEERRRRAAARYGRDETRGLKGEDEREVQVRGGDRG